AARGGRGGVRGVGAGAARLPDPRPPAVHGRGRPVHDPARDHGRAHHRGDPDDHGPGPPGPPGDGGRGGGPRPPAPPPPSPTRPGTTAVPTTGAIPTTTGRVPLTTGQTGPAGAPLTFRHLTIRLAKGWRAGGGGGHVEGATHR